MALTNKSAAQAYAAGMLNALPRVVGVEKPMVMLSTRQAAALIRAAFVRGCKWQRTGK
jgi:hypothetical protein